MAHRGSLPTTLEVRSAKLRQRLLGGHDDRGALLLYVGRLSAEKQIERIRPVLEALPDARLALVGDGPHRQQLEKYFDGTATTFVGYLAGEELAGAYASGDAFLFPSSTETLGLVLLEAMAAGCPVVGANRGGIPDIITEGVNGCLYEPDGADGGAAAARGAAPVGRRGARALSPSRPSPPPGGTPSGSQVSMASTR